MTYHIAQFHGDGYSPSFAYTIGLFKTYGYPELICFGLNLDLLHSVLWSGKELLDKQPVPNQSIGYPDFLGDFDVRLLTVDKGWYKAYFGYGYWFNQTWDFPALQIVWPDKQALFPWDEDFNPAWKFGQPLLDRSVDFKFREERNVAVFTTRQVLEGLPILRVVHEADGTWQFLCDTTTDVADLKIVCLDHIVELDASVNGLFQLNYGWTAWRETIEDDWETWEDPDEEEAAEEAEETGQ
ncbi:DUF4262 domain-containing protein [Hymenobacter siberiensis]|uniref:DUF4262 domain-containing protein n=1 Tax=Hymenobacter siberiensis TaxID=2848396 RepID=UPI001C1DE73E|nr:DUF4262 domain-containing protein [Hymenobacter siberiensis]